MEQYIQFAEKIAREAGGIMKKYFVVGMAHTDKADNSPVTVADLEINSLVVQEVAKLFPDHSVFGEEESNVVVGSEYVWVCDPIDGTIPYSLGLPVSVFSLALVRDGEVILGVVYDPFCDRLYSAQKGKGAYLNGIKMQVSKQTIIDRSRIEFEMFPRAKYDIRALTAELYTRGATLMQLCSLIDLSMLIAAGQLSAAIFPHTTAHDGATIKIIIEEAGGKVTDIFGEEQRYDQPINGLLVSNGILHDKLVAMTKKFVTLRQ